MARQQSGKAGGSTANTRKTRSKATRTTTKAKRPKTTAKATTKAATKSASKTGKSTKTVRTIKSTRTTSKPGRTIQKSMRAADVTAGINPTFEEIRWRAYEIYLARGRAPGDPIADWLQAERELRERKTSQKAVTAARRRLT